MRAYEIEESAVDDLKNRLPKLKDKSYNNVDRLMQHVCTRHKITGKKLHDMFVSKYGHTPDTWVNKIANRLGEDGVEEGKKKKKKKSSRSIGGYFFPGYGYYGSGDSGESGGDGGGGESINRGMAEGSEPDISVTVGKLYDIIDHQEDVIKNADFDRQVRYATIVRDRAVKALGMIKSDPSSVDIAWKYLQTGEQGVEEGWSQKYKKSINCSHPKGFSQKAHCAGKKKNNESVETKVMEMVCEDCGMCQSHGNLNEIKKGAKDSNGFTKCWPGKHAEGTKKGKNGGQVRNCVPNEGVEESSQKKSSKITEGVEGPEDIEKVKHFIKWSYKTLNIQKPYPRITLSKDTKKAQDGHHTGLHNGNDIWVYVANRNLIDIFRTIFHELTHHRQMQLNMIKDGDSYPGSPIEMLADMAAGKYIKLYGKDHPEMFQ